MMNALDGVFMNDIIKICKVENCDKPIDTSTKYATLCNVHRYNLYKYKSYDKPTKIIAVNVCKVDGCERLARTKNTVSSCDMHYIRWRLYQSYDLPIKEPLPEGIVRICKKHGPLKLEYTRAIKRKYIPKNPEKYTSIQNYCSECIKAKGRELYKKNPIPYAERTKSYRSKNIDKIKNYQHKWNLNNRESSKRKNIKRNYGITLEIYNKMLDKQNKVCAICKNYETSKHKDGKIRDLSIDHCHKSNEIRGLLCSRCNMGLWLHSRTPLPT